MTTVSMRKTEVTTTDRSIIDYFLKKTCKLRNDEYRRKCTDELCKRWESEAETYGHDLYGYLQRFIVIANAM